MRSVVLILSALTAAGCTASMQSPPDARALHHDAFVMDAHVHMVSRQFYLGGDIGDRYADGQVDLPRLREGGVDAFYFSIGVGDSYYPHRFETKHAFRLMQLALEQIENHSDHIEVALTASDIERINRAGKMAAILDIEGNFDLDGDVRLLRLMHRLGLRVYMLPAHNSPNALADSCCAPHRFGGLSDRGRELIREMNRLGMVINIAHGSNETILQTVEESRHPVVFSHGGFRHFVDIERGITEEAAKAVASRGGVIAVHFGNGFNNPAWFEWRQQRVARRLWTASEAPPPPPPVETIEELDRLTAKRYPIMPLVGPPEVTMDLNHMMKVFDHAIDLVGEDHVGLGIDWDGAVALPKELQDVSDYPKITEEFVRHGYSEERIRKLLGGNLLRLFREVTEGQSSTRVGER